MIRKWEHIFVTARTCNIAALKVMAHLSGGKKNGSN
jgi:hypothetical protein